MFAPPTLKGIIPSSHVWNTHNHTLTYLDTKAHTHPHSLTYTHTGMDTHILTLTQSHTCTHTLTLTQGSIYEGPDTRGVVFNPLVQSFPKIKVLHLTILPKRIALKIAIFIKFSLKDPDTTKENRPPITKNKQKADQYHIGHPRHVKLNEKWATFATRKTINVDQAIFS